MQFKYSYETKNVHGIETLFIVLTMNGETIGTCSLFGEGNQKANDNKVFYQARQMRDKYLLNRDKQPKYKLDYSNMRGA